MHSWLSCFIYLCCSFLALNFEDFPRVSGFALFRVLPIFNFLLNIHPDLLLSACVVLHALITLWAVGYQGEAALKYYLNIIVFLCLWAVLHVLPKLLQTR